MLRLQLGKKHVERVIAKCFESEDRETFTWDPASNLIAFESPDIRVERSFDPGGRMTAEKSGVFREGSEGTPLISTFDIKQHCNLG